MKNAINSLRRTPYQTLGILFALSFSFLILLIFSSTIILLTKVIGYIETQPQVTIYFLKTTPKSDIFRLREELLQTNKVKEVKYISQEQALQIYKELNKNEPLLLEMVSKDALPASLEVYTLKPEYLQDIAELAKKEGGVEEVAYQQDVVDNLIKITNSIKISALVFLTAQFLVVFFVIFTTLTFKIMVKREEIEILRLLGASRYFITRPLLKENLLINFLASVLSSAVFIGGYFSLQPKLNSFLVGIPSLVLYQNSSLLISIWPPNAYFFIILTGLTFIIGYILITITTYLASLKYIK